MVRFCLRPQEPHEVCIEMESISKGDIRKENRCTNFRPGDVAKDHSKHADQHIHTGRHWPIVEAPKEKKRG